MSIVTGEAKFTYADEFESDDGVFGSGRTLLIDGDILVYRPCCTNNEDDDASRKAIIRSIKSQIANMLRESGCDDYMFFLTTKTNFRDLLVDDYKANRSDTERPVNLAWAKRWAVNNLSAFFHKGLEADDLLGIYMTDKTVIWSLDKDLRQIAGMHLDDATRKVVNITEEGQIIDNGKVYFDGTIGLYYQLLIGDNTDFILGCAERKNVVTKSGPNKGQSKLKRVGIGPKAAIKILASAAMSRPSDQLQACKEAIAYNYQKIHGDGWQEVMETQANLLFMVREQHGEVIKRWTFDDRDEYFHLKEGVILNDYTPPVKAVGHS